MAPRCRCSVKAALDADGQIVDWQYELWSNTHSMRPQSTDGTNVLAAWYLAEPQKHGAAARHAAAGRRRRPQRHPALRFPEPAVVHHFIPEMPIRVSALRTLGAYANVFAIESFMDELAALAEGRSGRVPARAHEGPARAGGDREGRRDGELEAGRGGQPQPRPRHRLRQVQEPRDCYVAVIADVEVDRASGQVRVPRVWAAADSGLIINPDGLTQPDRGRHRPVDELDAVRAGAVRQERHPVARLGELSDPDHAGRAARSTVELINRPNERPLGAGEGSQGPAAAAIANAFAHATGKRLRDLPFDAGAGEGGAGINASRSACS